MASYRKNPDNINAPKKVRGCRVYSVDVSHIDTVRTYIRKANLQGCHISLESIQSFLSEKSRRRVISYIYPCKNFGSPKDLNLEKAYEPSI